MRSVFIPIPTSYYKDLYIILKLDTEYVNFNTSKINPTFLS